MRDYSEGTARFILYDINKILPDEAIAVFQWGRLPANKDGGGVHRGGSKVDRSSSRSYIQLDDTDIIVTIMSCLPSSGIVTLVLLPNGPCAIVTAANVKL